MAANIVSKISTNAVLSLLLLGVMNLRLWSLALRLGKWRCVRASCTSICFTLLLRAIRVDAVLMAMYPRDRCRFLLPTMCFFVSLWLFHPRLWSRCGHLMLNKVDKPLLLFFVFWFLSPLSLWWIGVNFPMLKTPPQMSGLWVQPWYQTHGQRCPW